MRDQDQGLEKMVTSIKNYDKPGMWRRRGRSFKASSSPRKRRFELRSSVWIASVASPEMPSEGFSSGAHQ
jgi:hypothetical protein